MVLAVLRVQRDNIRLIHLQRDLHLVMDQLYATHVRCAVLAQGYNLTVQLQETQYVTRAPLVNTRRYHSRDGMQRVLVVVHVPQVIIVRDVAVQVLEHVLLPPSLLK